MALALALASASASASASHSTPIPISTSTSTSSWALPRRSDLIAARAAAERVLDRARTTRRDTASHGEKAENMRPLPHVYAIPSPFARLAPLLTKRHSHIPITTMPPHPAGIASIAPPTRLGLRRFSRRNRSCTTTPRILAERRSH
ncbi:hypothetical protein [Burkholderia mallei]|uniref:hypothetical protein n=1 Tax=Burkholderia mallei TaxID=13373 RepID=UPI000AAD211D|nr:hypothetical protein [Burkholderia mallei]